MIKNYNTIPSKYLLLLLILSFMFSSCAKRNLTYMSDLNMDTSFQAAITNQGAVKIQPGDLLRISLTSLQPELNTMFNDASSELDFNRNFINNINAEGFLVSEVGEINIPVVGKIKVEGLTKSEATELIEKGIEEYLVGPVVTVRFANFKVTVIGEVNNPSTFYVPSEKLSIFEALGLAGDMTEFGLRENVLLIRESEGVRSVNKIDFTDKNLLKSPFYNLKQNDLIYVQPDRMKSVKAGTNERSMIFAGLAVSLLVPILFNWQNIFQY